MCMIEKSQKCFLAACATKLHTLSLLTLSSEPNLLLPAKCARQPIKAFVETVTSGRTSRLDEPLSVPHVVQTKLLGNLRGGHRIWKVLLVCEHKKNSIAP